MPIYEIKGPDGKIYSIEGPDGATRSEVIAAIERRKGGGASGAKPESGFFNSIAEGAKTLFSGDEATKFAAASPEERDSLRRKFLESTAGDTQGIGLSDVDNIPEFWQWLKQTAGQSLGAMAAPAAAGFASKLAGAPNPMARAVGYTAMGVQYVIDNLARQAQEQDAAITEGREVPETNVGKAIIGASAQAGLDVGVMELAFKPLLTRFPIVKALFEGGEIATKRNVAQLAQALKSGKLKVSNGLVKGMLFGAAVEAPQELVQTLIERWQAGLPLADAEAKKEYFEAAVGGGILGAGFGAGQKAMVNQGEIGLARDELGRQDAELQAQEAERAKAIEEQEKAAQEAELAKKAKFSTPAAPSAAPGVGVPRPVPGATTGAPKPKAMGADAYNALVGTATQFINDYTAKNGAVETTPDEWYNALEKGLNLRPGEASRLLGDLKRRKVLNFRASGEGLNSLYTPSVTEKRQKLLIDLDPEIRRVKGVATPEHITAIDKILATLGSSSVDEKGKPVYKRLQQTKVDSLTTELNTLLGIYGSGVPAGTGTPPPPADTTGTSVPPPDADADAAAKAQADADAAAKAQADADAAKAQADADAAKAQAAADAAKAQADADAAKAQADADAAAAAAAEQRAQILAKFKEDGKANVALVRAILGGTQSDAKAYFQQLIDAGIVVQVGNSTRYKLAEESKPPAGESGVNEDEDEDSDQPPVDPNDIPPQREEDEDFLDYTERFNKWKLNRSPEQAARIEQAQRKNASRDSNKLNKDKEFTAPDQGITYKFVDGGYGVEAYNDKNQVIGSLTTKDGSNVSNIEVAPEFRRKRIAEKMFDRLRRIHGTVGFKDSPLNEEGAKFAAHLYSTRKLTDNEVEVPGYVREAGDRAILKRKAQQVYKEVLKYALANNGVIPPSYVLEKQFNMNREEVGYGYVALANDGYIEPATQTETISGKKFTKQLNYFVATEKLKDAVAAEQAKQLGNDKPKEITLVPEEKEVSADVEEANLREGLLGYLGEKPRTDEEIKNEYEENLALASKVLTDLVTKGEVIYEKGTYRLKSVEKPAEKPKTTSETVVVMMKVGTVRKLFKQLIDAGVPGFTPESLKETVEQVLSDTSLLDSKIAKLENDLEAVVVMMKAGTVRKLFKQLIDAGVPGFTPESLKETMEQVLSDTSLLDSKIAKLENDLEAYNAGVSDFRTKKETKSHTDVTDKTRDAELKLAGKPVDNFIDYALRNGTMFQKVLAKRIQLRINEMRANGVNFTMQHIDDISDYKRVYGSSPVFSVVSGQVKYNFEYRESYATATFEITFTGNKLGFTGYNTTTILHELMHAATMYGYEIGRYNKAATTRPVWHKASLDIIKLHGYVGREAIKLRDEGKLTPEEKYLVDETNFLKAPQELIAWGQTDDTAKRLLERISYGTNERGEARTAWDAFVSIMRRLLGLSAEADTALSELLHLTSAFLVEDTSGFASDASQSETLSGAAQSAMNTNPNVYVAKPIHVGNFDDTTKRLAQQEAVRIDAPKGIRETLGNLFSQNKWERIVTNFQNERRPLKRLSDLLDAAGLLDVFKRVNDLYGEITRSMAMSENILNETMWRHMVDVDKQVLELSEATGKTKDVVLAELQQFVMGRHESERRKAFYEMFVPLNNRVNTMLDAKLLKNIMVIPRDENGKPMKKATSMPLASISAPPARLRQIIMTELNQNQDLVSNGYAESMRSALSELIERNNKQNVDGTVDGFSPMLGKKGLRLSTDINDRVYDVIGAYSRNQINEMETRYKAALADPKAGPILKRMLDPNTGSIAMLQKATIAADKISNYWSNPVDNRKAFYGWKYYVPLKGSVDTAANKAALDELNFQGDRLGGGFNDVQGEMGGRENDSENPVLRTLVDATKSAIRYGRKGTMEAIGNLIDKDPRTDKQYLKGKKVGNIPFDQRMNMIGDKKFSGPDKFFVYRANGSIDVYEITDKDMKEAIRRTFSAPNKLVDMANAVTSGIGHLHTRYNVAFHPYNFVRDALTNAFTLGAEFGPAMSATLLKAVATRVSQSGMLLRAAKISKLYTDGKLDEIERMAKAGDIFAADALRYFKRGGRVTRLSGTDIREQGERMMRDLRRGNVARSKEMLDSVVDNWADSFELTSRLATFGVLRNYYTSKGMSEQEAEIRATTYAKNLANFEQVGKYGRVAGSLFMFFRPAATGAVRAIDALTPAFQSWESYKKNIPEDILGEPNGTAYKKIEKDFLARKKSAQGMMMALAGAGAMMWTMAWMMSDDDEIGRNRTGTDKMSLWTRNARMPLSFLGEKYKDSYFQIPWGFGVGAFGAIGAQIAGVAGGYTTMGEAIPNLITIGLDSYMPVPVSRIDPTENFSAFAASSFFPSAARPLLEYAMNVDGLGREIYNDRQTRYGDAFTGGRNTPQLWKDTARMLFNASGGEWDVDPDTMLFFANNYMDGFTRIAQSGYGLSLTLSGEKNFSLKEDFAPLSSFVGRASNYDGEKYANLEQHMRELNQRIRSLERDPDLYREYMQSNYTEYQAVQMFNRDSNGWLRKLRQMRNQIEASDIAPNVKEERLRGVYLATAYVKRGLLARASDAGVSL